MGGRDEELWQAYNELGEPVTGQSITKLQAREGALHAASHLWIWRGKGDGIEVLLQQRAKDKLTWPGYFDISAAGHVDFGETAVRTTVRETQEELGYNVDPASMRLLFVHRQYVVDETSGVIENEFQWVYGLKLKQPVTFTHADGEVDATVWMKLPELQALIDGRTDHRIVPHGDAYFASLRKEIARS